MPDSSPPKITLADASSGFPLSVTLADSLSSNLAVGSPIATCTTIIDSPSWSLGPDDTAFAIDDTGIVTNTVSPIPAGTTNLTVTATSPDGSESVSLTVSLPLIQLPDFQGLVLRPDTIQDNASAGTIVGTLVANISGIDPASITYTLIDPSDTGFSLQDDQVVLDAQLAIDSYTLTIEVASSQAHQPASFPVTVQVIATPPARAGDVFYDKVKEGIVITSTSDSSLNATYAMDQGRLDTVGAIARDAASGIGLPNDLAYFDYADIDGVSHRFDDNHLISFYKAMRDLMQNLITQAKVMADGGTPVWPSNEVTIP
jgi:hypothetical protein